MTLDEIHKLWEIDSVIDKTKLVDESLRKPLLHYKYYKILIDETLILKKMESKFKTLKLEKTEFYSDGPTKETQEKGWKYPSKGIILKKDVPLYVESDSDIIELNLKTDLQQEKVDYLISIIKTVSDRDWTIKNAVEVLKFNAGS